MCCRLLENGISFNQFSLLLSDFQICCDTSFTSQLVRSSLLLCDFLLRMYFGLSYLFTDLFGIINTKLFDNAFSSAKPCLLEAMISTLVYYSSLVAFS